MTSSLDYYRVLGVTSTASITEIRRAYRVRVRDLHPDVNPDPDAVAALRDVLEAFTVLGNTNRRQTYDEQRLLRDFGSALLPPEAFETFVMVLQNIASGVAEGDVWSAFGRADQNGMDLELPVSIPANVWQSADPVIEVAVGKGQFRRIRLPAEAQPGAHIRVPGAGLARPEGGPRGDLYLRLDRAETADGQESPHEEVGCS